ncbi:hypothetical protein [Subtercola sp. YIM 133946]|uniref:hypothetical protein n=1 Tax=Subtercola sp. YIM 133946 TaxID=3118909 RepID=UPI002F944350
MSTEYPEAVAYPPEAFEPLTETGVGQTTTPGTDGASASGGAVDTAKEQAGQVAGTAADAGAQVASTAKEQAGNVAAEAKTQAKDLIGQAQSELKEQAASQQKRVASGLRALSDELGSMAQGSESGGVATDLVNQAASRSGAIAAWLDDRDPGSLLEDVKQFARQRPGVFIGAAAVAGILAGRLTRSLASAAKDEAAASAPAEGTSAPTVPEPDAYVAPTAFVEPATYVEPTYAETTAYAEPATYTEPTTYTETTTYADGDVLADDTLDKGYQS